MRLPVIIPALAALVLPVALTSCKGRTLDDITPTGDTVEVVVNIDSSVTDDIVRDVAAEPASPENSTSMMPDTATSQYSGYMTDENISTMLNITRQTDNN